MKSYFMLPFGPTLNIQLRKNFMGKFFFFAINKTFLQTTAVQGTIKKWKGNRKNIFSILHLHTSVMVLCLHSSTEHQIP